MTGGPGSLPEPPNPSGTLPSALCLSLQPRRRRPSGSVWFSDIDASRFAQRLEHAGMIHEDVDERLALDCDRSAGASRAIVSPVQGLELFHCGIELENGTTAYGAGLRLAGVGMVSTPGMFETSAPAAAYRAATTCSGA